MVKTGLHWSVLSKTRRTAKPLVITIPVASSTTAADHMTLRISWLSPYRPPSTSSCRLSQWKAICAGCSHPGRCYGEVQRKWTGVAYREWTCLSGTCRWIHYPYRPKMAYVVSLPLAWSWRAQTAFHLLLHPNIYIPLQPFLAHPSILPICWMREKHGPLCRVWGADAGALSHVRLSRSHKVSRNAL